mgnify:CR=1 FL=1
MEFDYNETILSVKDLEVQFNLRGQTLTAIRGISLDLYKGESLAIVGESGSGKSVFTKTFMGMLDKNGNITAGEILYKGMDLAKFTKEKDWLKVRGREIAMVFQDPMTSLNPLKTVGKQIQEALEMHQGLRGNAAKEKTVDDMGGAAAVIGAMSAIANQKLPVNVVGVIAACENKLSYDSYTPGDIIGSMAGKSIEVTNTDAEGRLTLADAITYAIRKERCDILVDIATLTGAAKAAVGKYSSAVITNDDVLYAALRHAAYCSSEKVWRLDADEEMRVCLNSSVADIKNASGATTDGGGCILAGLFLQEFTEKKPWLHIDMAGVNFRTEPPAFSASGATGYGAALLFYLTRELQKYLKDAERCDKK